MKKHMDLNIETNSDYQMTDLVDLADLIMGQSPASSTYNTEGKGLPFFQGKAEFTELYPVVEKWCSEPNKIALPGDILMSVRAPVGATNLANCECCIGRGLAAIRYPQCNKYLFYYFRLIARKLDEQGTGTTFRAISGDVLRNTTIPLPPLPEQRRIVARIEELFSDLDKGVQALKTAQAQLAVYRQAVLKAAFAGFPFVKFDSLISYSQNGISKRKGSEGDFYKVLRLADIKNMKINNSTSRQIMLSNKEVEKYSLVEGDLLCIRVNGSKDLVGGMIYVEKKNELEKWCFCDHLIRFILDTKKAYSKFFMYYFHTVEVRRYIQNNMVTSAGQNTVSQTIIANIPIPLPPLPEQHALVAAIESRLSVCDSMEASITAALGQAEALRQSILKKAFEGRLLSEAELVACRAEPDWEPAEALLARIKAEREGADKGKQATRRPVRAQGGPVRAQDIAPAPRKKAAGKKSAGRKGRAG